jgi:hypothetical protein
MDFELKKNFHLIPPNLASRVIRLNSIESLINKAEVSRRTEQSWIIKHVHAVKGVTR